MCHLANRFAAKNPNGHRLKAMQKVHSILEKVSAIRVTI